MTNIERNWKKAFDPNFDEEGNSKATDKTGLTQSQKGWLARAWANFFGQVPNAMPDEDRDDGKLAVKKSDGTTQWHHIYPQGASIRLSAEDPDRPENIAPIDAFNHTGAGVIGQVDEDSPVIHTDTANARQHYKPNQHPNSFELADLERKHITRDGKEYWNGTYDEWLRYLALQVTTTYNTQHPEDKFPEHKRRR